MTIAQTPLPYADLPARWGVAVDREPNLVRIAVPPIPGWRFLSLGFHIAIPILAMMTLGYRKLFVHVLGHELVEVYIGPNADVCRWVAQQIREALNTVPLAVEPSGSVQREADDHAIRARARAVLLTIAVVTACAGTALLFMGDTPRFIGAFLIFVAVLPLGIALGTQPTKFWT
jgi:hypothetical protein